MARKLFMMGMVMMTAVFAAHLLLTTLQTAVAAAPTDALVLYDGALGGTPDTQLMEYGAIDLEFPPFPPIVEATQTYSSLLQATILDTLPDISDMAGYGVTPTIAPTLSRQTGFQLSFTVRMAAENHANNNRAGFSVTLLSEDALGIEIAFWDDEIWAQEGGVSPQLFTHAEEVAFDTTVWTDYDLEIISGTYQLRANGTPILTGPIRDYSAWQPPLPQFPDPYEQPNLIAMSDNSSSARGEIWISTVAVTTNTTPVVDVMPSALTISETAGTAVLTVQLSFTSTFTATVNYETVEGTAVGSVDYTPISGTLTFTPGVTSQSLAIPILDNTLDEPDRQFNLTLSAPTFSQLGQSSAIITIADDDVITVEPPNMLYLPVVLRP